MLTFKSENCKIFFLCVGGGGGRVEDVRHGRGCVCVWGGGGGRCQQQAEGGPTKKK